MMGIMRILISVLLFIPVSGHAFTPTQAQIEAFKNLSPDEQKKLAEQYGVDLPKAGSNRANEVTSPVVVEPRATNDGGKQGNVLEEEAKKSTDFVDLKEHKDNQATYQDLKQFGYDLFAGSPTTFAPVTDIPVPVDYVVGPGDTIIVQLYGKENASYELAVSREGVIQFPGVGPTSVAGQSFRELKDHLGDVVARKMIGVKISVSMGALRSIRVFVLGEAHRPGSYTVSSLSTVTNALFVSGGITKVGSLRRIQLKRRGKVVSELDLYDLLLKGDTSSDEKLLPGDVIFIPSIGATAGISGDVKRPAIYELKNEDKVYELVELAGGYLPSAYPKVSRIERINTSGSRTIVDVDLTKKQDRKTKLENGDVLQVFSVLDKMDGVILLKGHVQRPGGFAWKKGMRVTDVIESIDSLLPNPDLNYALIKRESIPERKLSVKTVSLGQAISRPSSEENVFLQARDELFVFGSEQNRSSVVTPLVQRLKSQADFQNPAKVVRVKGNVRFADEYPLESDMRIQDLIDAAGGLKSNTDLDYALLVREDHQRSRVEVTQVSLGNPRNLEIKLTPKDDLYVFDLDSPRSELIETLLGRLEQQASATEELRIVTVSGLVRFPGRYPLISDMSVTDLVKAAGGYREAAYTLEAEITRSFISDEKVQEYVRVEVDLKSDKDALLLSRDRLYVKKIPHWADQETVTVSGEVRFPGVYPIYKGDTVVDLVKRAGGVSEFGDPSAAIFMREDLRRREQQQILKFRAQLEKDIAELKLEDAQDSDGSDATAEIGSAMLKQLSTANATGRLVIELPKMLSGDFQGQVVLKNNDRLVIPRISNEVSVVGEVQFPTSHLYESGLNVFDYIDVSGGFTSKSDDDRIYVIKPNGRIVSVKNGWFFDKNTAIGPGDTVVVPYDTDAISPMSYWVSVSQILFQLATTVAALETVGVFN